MHGLSGKRVLITGGARGIGAASAKKFMDEGARTAILDIDPEAIQKIQAVYPGIELALAADVSDHHAVASSFKVLDEIFGGLDILINNAGISIQHSFLDITPDEWQRVIGVDLDGAFYAAQQAARRMMAAGGGVIINMASTNALRGYPWYADYNAAKAGVLSLTKTMALELAPKVRVVAVCPGYVLTPMQKAEYTSGQMKELEKRIPLARQAAPEEIAALFAYLASDDASFITGSEIVIDGGEIVGTAAGQKE